MAVEVDWGVIQSNQAVLSGQVSDVNGRPLPLTGLTLSFVLKASETATDASGSTFTPTITSAARGEWSLTIPGSDFATAGTLWYRLDVVDGSSNHITAALGSVSVKAA